MSDEDKSQAPETSIVDEESWEEDTVEADVAQMVAEQTSSADDQDAPDAPELESTDPPLDEELSESMRHEPPPPPVRESQRPEAPQGDVPEPGATPFAQQLLKARRTGTAMWFAGVFLWAYIVVGEFVVGAELPEFFGWSAFAGIVVGAFLHGANRVGTEDMWKVAGAGVGAVILAVLMVSTMGSSRRSVYQAISFLLLAVSVGLIFLGRRHARGGLPPPLKQPGIKWGRTLLWLAFFGNTGLIAIVFLDNM